MKLTNFNIQSVASKGTKSTLIREGGRIKMVTEKVVVNKNLITTKAIEWKHTQFKCEVNNRLLDVVCPGYQPKIIFSAKINTYWEYPKPAITANRDTVDDLDIYWDYIYEGMEIKGIVQDRNFILDIKILERDVSKFYDIYTREQLKEAKANKKIK